MKDNRSFRILDENNNLIPATIEEWGKRFENKQTVVGNTVLSRRKKIFVSTVLLGINHSWVPGRELWFETMVFGTSMNGFQRRYETYRQAQLGHEIAVSYARNARQLPYKNV